MVINTNNLIENNLKKIDEIKESVFHKVDETAENIIERAEKEKEKILKEIENDCIVSANQQVSENTKQIEQAVGRRISKMKFESYCAVLKRRDELINDFFNEIEKKLLEFSKSKNYALFIANNLKMVDIEIGLEDCVVYVKKEDVENKLLFKGFDIEVKYFEKIKLGGINIFKPGRNIWVDLTLDKLLNHEKTIFINKKELAM